MTKKSFLTDVRTLRKQARQHIDEGAVTSGYAADRKTVLKLLNDALATEIVCVLRYRVIILWPGESNRKASPTNSWRTRMRSWGLPPRKPG